MPHGDEGIPIEIAYPLGKLPVRFGQQPRHGAFQLKAHDPADLGRLGQRQLGDVEGRMHGADDAVLAIDQGAVDIEDDQAHAGQCVSLAGRPAAAVFVALFEVAQAVSGLRELTLNPCI